MWICSLEHRFLENSQNSIDMFPRTDDIINEPQTKIPSTQATLSAWYWWVRPAKLANANRWKSCSGKGRAAT